MSKTILISLILVFVVLSGCASPPQEDDTGGPAEAVVDTTASEEDIAELDTGIAELESLIEDSDFEGDSFLELDESTFE